MQASESRSIVAERLEFTNSRYSRIRESKPPTISELEKEQSLHGESGRQTEDARVRGNGRVVSRRSRVTETTRSKHRAQVELTFYIVDVVEF